MLTFIVLAAVLAGVGVALVTIPLLRRAPIELSPAPWAALVAAGVLVVGSAVLYASLSNWSWRAEPSADSPQTMVARLARKLERNPNDLNGWLMLGRSYVVLQQYPLAVRSFQRADRLAGGKSPDALVGEAEALALGDETELDRRAGRLVEQALVLDPNSGKALFFGAAIALRRGQLPLARERFAKLLALNPPESIKPLLKQQIAAIDQSLAGGKESASPSAMQSNTAATAGRSPAGAVGKAGSPVAKAGEGSVAQGAAGPVVRVNVSLSPALSNPATDTAPLFVFVRDPAQPGPPLAVKRLASHFPQTIELTPADSMVPGRAITAGQKVQVVARIARSGNPVGASGDLFGEVAYLVGQDGLANIVIDRTVP